MTQRSPGIYHILEIVIHSLRRRVAVRIYLIDHHLTLFLDFSLWKLRVYCEVCHELYCPGSIALREDGVDGGVFFGGESVELAAYRLHAVDDVVGAAPCSAFEDGMLNQMSEAEIAVAFISAAGLYGHAEDTGACAMIPQVHQAQAGR